MGIILLSCSTLSEISMPTKLVSFIKQVPEGGWWRMVGAWFGHLNVGKESNIEYVTYIMIFRSKKDGGNRLE